jgi:ABC-type bacteriocin/lantibiotic exporter with double-glycine peptidase domain
MFRSFPRGLVLACCLVSALWAAEAAVWIDVPFVKQERNGCGAASIAMVMQYWQRQQGRLADPQANAGDIQRALYSTKAHGIYASVMERYFEEHQFRTFSFRGEWIDLVQHAEKGRPLIVALKPESGAELHYVVVAGVDRERELVLVNDPAERKLLEREWQTFQREWKGAGNWALLALPREGSSSVR